MVKTVDDFHMAKGDGLFFYGTSMMALCGMALFSVLVAWAVGGSDFKNNIFGNTTMIMLGIGFIVGAVLDYFGQKRRHGK